jgi:hypothetical protein
MIQASPESTRRLPLGTQSVFVHTLCHSTAEFCFQRVIELPDIVKLGVNI